MTQSAQKIRDYHVIKKLGQNKEGGRVTYLAQSPDGQKVVIKEFQFLGDSKWEDYSAIAREVDILKTLDHPRIPKFIESFETDRGACLIQEYIDAPNLDQKRTFTFEQIKQLGIDLLEMLVYLQSLNPPVLHRDIKPGNLLLDADRNLYLVDFGFSRIGLQDIAASSMVRGTTGFMPPEQFLGRELSKASDLYSVGATLVCLMLGIPSGHMAELVDVGENRLKFSDRLSDADPRFMQWLKRLTEPRVSDRFPDAVDALEGLRKSESVEVEEGHQTSQLTEHRSGQENLTAFQYRKKIALLDVKIRRANLRHQQNPTDIVAEKTYYDAIEEKRKLMSGESEIEKSSVGFVLKPWHLYAGYTVSVLAVTGGLYFFFGPAMTTELNAKKPEFISVDMATHTRTEYFEVDRRPMPSTGKEEPGCAIANDKYYCGGKQYSSNQPSKNEN